MHYRFRIRNEGEQEWASFDVDSKRVETVIEVLRYSLFDTSETYEVLAFRHETPIQAIFHRNTPGPVVLFINRVLCESKSKATVAFGSTKKLTQISSFHKNSQSELESIIVCITDFFRFGGIEADECPKVDIKLGTSRYIAVGIKSEEAIRAILYEVIQDESHNEYELESEYEDGGKFNQTETVKLDRNAGSGPGSTGSVI